MGALDWDLYKESMLTNSGYLDEMVSTFRDAADAFADVVARPEIARAWAEPSALEGYSVGGIVAHVNGAIGWTDRVLGEPPPRDVKAMPLTDLLLVLHGLKINPDGTGRHPIHDVLRDHFETTAAKGWEANRDKFESLAARLTDRLEGESADRICDLRPTAPLVIRLGDWIPTRVLELVIHADDLAASVGIDAPRLPESAATVTIDVLVATARAAHGDLAVLRALARRERADTAVFPVI